MAGARRKQSTARMSKAQTGQVLESSPLDGPRENVFLFVPNLIGTLLPFSPEVMHA